MKKPLIALTPTPDASGKSYHIYKAYMDSVEASGGIPVMLGMHPDAQDVVRLAESFDGFLFAGGDDIFPALYGEETMLKCGEITPCRDETELALYSAVLDADKPMLGICRGIQLMNVAGGGTLYQDIPSQVRSETPLQHSQSSAPEVPTQRISIVPDTLLSEIYSGRDSIFMNSHHHQAVNELAPDYKRCAYTSDGITEGIYMPHRRFVLGVQWHPERLTAVSGDAKALFDAFIEAARENMHK